jgi:hypothetical protein
MARNECHRRGEPVAWLDPASVIPSKPDVWRVIDELKAFGEGNTDGDGISAHVFKNGWMAAASCLG